MGTPKAQMNKPGRRGLPRIVDAAIYSVRGYRAAWAHEEGFRTECRLLLILLPAAYWLAQSGVEFALLIGTCVLVLVAELLNSAIEAAVDRISHAPHTLSGQAKDMGSAAVFTCMMLVLFTWGTIAICRFWPS